MTSTRPTARMPARRRSLERQEEPWVPTAAMATAPGHPFDREINGLGRGADFDRRVEVLVAPLHGEGAGPSLPPGTYLRTLRVGDFEDIERGIAGRCAGSLSLKESLGDRPQGSAPNHSRRSPIRTRLGEEMHRRGGVSTRRCWALNRRRWSPRRRLGAASAAITGAGLRCS